ncbi:MAG: isoprenylcysteine carboxylmethyltransferase family protein [Anaerolineae bacterium]|nr:isoprenylcysteine carboxylmethyltransferase family protein [Anaerolineae bacterium]
MVLGKVVFILALILQIVIRYPYRTQAQTHQPDRQEQVLLTLLTIGGLVIPFIYIFTDWLAFADYASSMGIVGLGILVMAAGLGLFWRSHTDLGRNWSSTLEIHEEHRLITQGIYRQIRHPMYAAAWLMMIAQALLLSNWAAGFGGLISFGLMYFLRVPKEEQMMLEEFGEPYQHYMQQTGRIIPRRG